MTAMQRAVGFQRWRELLFLHWAMPPGALRPLVPAALELDLFEGAAWVTLIPFEIVESRPLGFPSALADRFLEVNLRTYVRGPGGEPGIYFWSLEASSLLAVLGARLLYGLPYFPARMSMRRAGMHVEYTSHRRIGGWAELRLGWTVAEAIGTARPGTLDHFLIERYVLYAARMRGLYRARVRHPPYPLHRASIDHLSETLLAAAGIAAPTEPPSIHFSPGVDVDIFPLKRVGTGA
jgi:uncharacterized protein YqjF (DUF2071 family)